MKTLEAYGKLPDQKTNSLDSLGEAYFMNGRFAEAEKYFLQAYDSNHGFLGGAGSAEGGLCSLAGRGFEGRGWVDDAVS